MATANSTPNIHLQQMKTLNTHPWYCAASREERNSANWHSWHEGNWSNYCFKVINLESVQRSCLPGLIWNPNLSFLPHPSWICSNEVLHINVHMPYCDSMILLYQHRREDKGPLIIYAHLGVNASYKSDKEFSTFTRALPHKARDRGIVFATCFMFLWSFSIKIGG